MNRYEGLARENVHRTFDKRSANSGWQTHTPVSATYAQATDRAKACKTSGLHPCRYYPLSVTHATIPMSSIVGHSLVALALHESSTPVSSAKTNWWGVAALIMLASAPDIDYLIPLLRPVAPAAPPDQLSWWICSWMGCTATMAPHTIRVTHSFVGIFVLVGITLALLLPVHVPRQLWEVFAFQAIAVGLSHLLLDFLVSATPTAFFWPFSNTSVILPLSILPRLGEISLTNPTMYRAVLIELIVFASLWAGVYWFRRRHRG